MAAESITTETVEKSVNEESTVASKENEDTQNPPPESAKPPADEEDSEPTPAKKRDGGSVEQNEDAPEEEVDISEEKANLDDDQNVENPAYIPKTGRFYMHDDNRRGDVSHGQESDGEDRRNLKKSRADGDWKHDRFDEKFQRPKTKKQIVTKYGFDIRHKGGAPVPGDDKETTALESTEEESSDARQVLPSRPQKDRRVVTSRPGKGGAARRPMKQREREDTVDESEGGDKEEEKEGKVRQAQKKQVKQQQQEKPRKQQKPAAPPSSEENEEEDDDEAIRRGQRRSVPMRRGAASGPPSRLRGRMSHPMPPRRSSGVASSRPLSSHGKRPVESSSRGPPPTSSSRRDYSHHGDRNDDRFENHRRGVIRGASRGGGVSRGGNYGRSGGAVRGGTRGTTGPRYHGSGVRKADTSEQSEGYQRGGSGTDYSSPRPSEQPQPLPERSYPSSSNSFRGGPHPHPSANVYPSSRGGFQNNAGGNINYAPRGGHGYHGPPQHHHSHHQKRFVQGPPHIPAVGVLPGNVVPPPQMSRGATHVGHGSHYNGGEQQRIRQPTDVVYFDPQQQQVIRQLPKRVKKVIPIVDPKDQK